MAGTLLLLFVSLSITTNLFNNALAANPPQDPPQNNLGDSNCPPHRDCPVSAKANFLIVFGDSLFDVGFGIDELCLPSKYPPYGQKLKFQTGRFSDGRTIPDFIAEYVLGAAVDRVTPYTCNLIKTTTKFTGKSLSFAQAGATVLEGISKGTGKTLGEQVELFNKLDDKFFGEASERKEETLYLISIGAFDYLREIIKETPTSIESTDEIPISIDPTEVVKKIVDTVKIIINKKGGRRFGFMNIGPLRYYPAVQQLKLGNKNLENLDKLVEKHNKELEEHLREAFKDSRYSYSILDYHRIIKNIMEEPGSYGFDTHTIKSACCGWGPFNGEGCGSLDKEGCGEHSIEDYVFFDGIHHTEHINHHLAKIFWNSNELASPNNLKSIAALARTEFDFPRF